MVTRHESTEYEDQSTHDGELPLENVRMVDWWRAFAGPILIALLLLFLIFTNGAGIVLGMPFIVLLIWQSIIRFQGIAFNGSQDELTYPSLWGFYRRRLRLSETRDANCQIISRKYRHQPMRMGTERPRASTVTATEFEVNLSGDYGARRIRFADKYKRDQFISLLRRYAPHVRVTRWS